MYARHQFFGTSEHYGKAPGSLLSEWMNYNYTACCWFPASNNILILPSQFWQIRFESYWLHCSKCRILVLLRYMPLISQSVNLRQCCITNAKWMAFPNTKVAIFNVVNAAALELHAVYPQILCSEIHRELSTTKVMTFWEGSIQTSFLAICKFVFWIVPLEYWCPWVTLSSGVFFK